MSGGETICKRRTNDPPVELPQPRSRCYNPVKFHSPGPSPHPVQTLRLSQRVDQTNLQGGAERKDRVHGLSELLQTSN